MTKFLIVLLLYSFIYFYCTCMNAFSDSTTLPKEKIKQKVILYQVTGKYHKLQITHPKCKYSLWKKNKTNFPGF